MLLTQCKTQQTRTNKLIVKGLQTAYNILCPLHIQHFHRVLYFLCVLLSFQERLQPLRVGGWFLLSQCTFFLISFVPFILKTRQVGFEQAVLGYSIHKLVFTTPEEQIMHAEQLLLVHRMSVNPRQVHISRSAGTNEKQRGSSEGWCSSGSASPHLPPLFLMEFNNKRVLICPKFYLDLITLI